LGRQPDRLFLVDYFEELTWSEIFPGQQECREF
jgi:hypothetical protein